MFKNFPYGGAALALLFLAFGSGAYIVAHPIPKPTATIRYWVFAKSHYDAYAEAIPEFERTHPGVKIDMQLVSQDAVGQRLNAAFWSNLDVPDVVETEIGTAGTFFRGSLANIGFLDLTDRINREGWKEKMVTSRFSPYTTRGRIFGLPNDVHPVQIAYRRDIFEKEGIDLSKVQTWDEFIAIGRKVTRTTGNNKRYMIEIGENSADHFDTLLFQRGGGLFNQDGKCIFDDENGVKTMEFLVPLVAGDKRIANSLGWGAETTQAIETGYLLCILAPDWRTRTDLENNTGGAKGKMALMPLPAIEPGGRRTSTWGGTMLGITKHCKDPDLAWDFAKFLYTNDKDLAKRFANTNIIPPVKSAWDLPEFKKPNAYFSGQHLGTMYAKLAPQTPPQYGSPFLGTAKAKVSEAMVDCVAYYHDHGNEGFDAHVRKTLKDKADYIRLVMTRNPDYDKTQKPLQTARADARIATK